MKYLVLLVGLSLAASIATYVRYQSLHPCDWMEHDLADEWGVPRLMARAKIRAEFLLDGIAEPGPSECLMGWWEMRAEAVERETKP